MSACTPFDTSHPSVFLINDNYQIGFHIQKTGSLISSFERAFHDPNMCLRGYQIMLSNNILLPEILAANRWLKRRNKFCYIHAAMWYNLCGSVQGKLDKEFDMKINRVRINLLKELDIAAGIGAHVVVHIGSCINKKQGIEQIVETISNVLVDTSPLSREIAAALNIPIDEFIKKRILLLENAAGEGNKIGSSIGEIVSILDKLDSKQRSQVRVCIDTAHIFGAGQYDLSLSREITRFFNDIGDWVEMIHLNDSLVPFGSKKDRHQNLTQGFIFKNKECLAQFVNTACERGIKLIGEPPKMNSVINYKILNDIVNLETIKQLYDN